MRVLRPLLLLAALAGIASSCDATLGAQAAKVNGESISSQNLSSDLSAISSHRELACALGGNGQAGTVGAGGAGTVDSALAANWLTTMIEAKALVPILRERHLVVTPFAVALGQSQVTNIVGGASAAQSCATTTAVLVRDLPANFKAALLSLSEEASVLAEHLAGLAATPAAASAYAKSHANATDQACVSVIIVASEAKAAALAREARSGTSFAKLATANSIDQSSAAQGGAVGCAQPIDFQSPLGQAFTALKVGAISDPIAFGGNFVVATVTSRLASPLVDVGNFIVENENAAVQKLVNSQLGKMSISVDPEFGRWTKVNGIWQVSPPSGPANALLLNPLAVTPSTTAPSTAG